MKYLTALLLILCNISFAQNRAQLLERQLNGDPNYTLVSARESDPNMVLVFDRKTYKEDYYSDGNITLGTVQYTGALFREETANVQFASIDINSCKKDKGAIVYAMYSRSAAGKITGFDLSRNDIDAKFSNDIMRAICTIKDYNDSLVNVKVVP